MGHLHWTPDLWRGLLRLVSWSTQLAGTKYHRACGLHNRHLCPHRSGGWKSLELYCESSLPPLQAVAFLFAPHMAFPWSVLGLFKGLVTLYRAEEALSRWVWHRELLRRWQEARWFHHSCIRLSKSVRFPGWEEWQDVLVNGVSSICRPTWKIWFFPHVKHGYNCIYWIDMTGLLTFLKSRNIFLLVI